MTRLKLQIPTRHPIPGKDLRWSYGTGSDSSSFLTSPKDPWGSLCPLLLRGRRKNTLMNCTEVVQGCFCGWETPPWTTEDSVYQWEMRETQISSPVPTHSGATTPTWTGKGVGGEATDTLASPSIPDVTLPFLLKNCEEELTKRRGTQRGWVGM